jgi:predicted permease
MAVRGGALYRIALWLVPRSVRERTGDELLEVIEARLRSEPRRWERVQLWMRELAGVVRLALGARHRDGWSARADRVLEGAAMGGPGSGGGRRMRGRGGALLQDLRFAVRAARRRPAPWLLAVGTCGVGIGAAVAMFSVADTVLFRALPYPDADRVVSVYPTIPAWRGHPSQDAWWDRARFSQPEYHEWLARQTSFEQAAAVTRRSSTLFDEGGAQRFEMGLTTPGLFEMLGAAPVLGRSFTVEDGRPGATPVAVISHAFWQSRFGGRRDVLGLDLRLEGGERTIVGVLPSHFRLRDFDSPIWAPALGVVDEAGRGDHSLVVVARLAPGVSAERAQLESEALLENLSEKHPQGPVHGARVVPRLEDDTRLVRTPLLILLLSSWLLLAVACVNVAALLLGLGIDREQELVVRGALGAGRGRLVRQLVTESVALAVTGGLAGIGLATALGKAMVRLAPAGVPRIDEVHVDARVLAFALAAVLLVGIAFGLVPALSLTSRDMAGRLREARARRRRARLHGGLVTLQLAMTTLLLFGGGLLTRTLLELDAVDPGFDPRGVLTVQLAPPYDRFREGNAFDGARFDRYFERLSAALEAAPGVRAVGITTAPPFSGSRSNNEIEIDGYTPAPGEVMLGERYAVSANYMDILRMRIVEGRGFTPADDRPGAAKVTIVTENLARRYFAGRSAVGGRLRFWGGTHIVIGVVADVRDRSLAGDDDVRYYMPRGELGGQGGHFVLRVDGADPAKLADAVRASILSVDPDVAITAIVPMPQRIRDSLVDQRFRAGLMMSFAVLALILAVLGTYGVVSRAVASRSREMGVRVALGAERSGVVALVLRQGMVLAAAGIALGLPASILLARALSGFLYGTRPADPLMLAGTALLVVTLAGLACIAPARRAARVDPASALRAD